jgi:hypothetical protein
LKPLHWRQRPPVHTWQALGLILNVALSMSNGMALVEYAAVGTGAVFLTMGAIAQTTLLIGSVAHVLVMAVALRGAIEK